MSYIVVDIGGLLVRGGVFGAGAQVCKMHHALDKKKYIKGISSFELPPYYELSNAALTMSEKRRLQESIIESDEIHGTLGHLYGQDNNMLCWKSRINVILDELLDELLIFNHRKLIVIMVEPPFTSEVFKDQVADSFARFKIKSLIWFSEPIAQVIGANSSDGLVVHMGWSSSIVSVVSDLRVINSKEVSYFCGSTLHYRLIEHILKKTGKKLTGLSNDVLFEKIELFIQNTLCIDPNNLEKLFHINLDKNFEISFQMNEIIDILQQMSQSTGLITTITTIIAKSSIDLRNVLRENIIISGGLSNIPGMKNFIFENLKITYPDAKCILTLGSWVGCSLYFSCLSRSDIKRMVALKDK